MRWRYWPLALVLLLAAYWGWRQESSLRAKLQELDELRPLLGQATALAAQNEVTSSLAADSDELLRRREEKFELLRLRSEVGELRRQGAQTPEAIRHEIELAQQRSVEARKKAELLQARVQAEDLSKQTQAALQHYLQFVTVGSDGSLPRSWEEERERLMRFQPATTRFTEVQVEKIRARLLHDFDSSLTNMIKPTDFEILPVSPRIAWRGELPPRALLLRERKPRALPDGGWERAYAFLDESVVMAKSEDGNFEPWEHEAVSK